MKALFLIYNERISFAFWLCLLHLPRSRYEDAGSLIYYSGEQISQIFAKGIVLSKKHVEVYLTALPGCLELVSCPL